MTDRPDVSRGPQSAPPDLRLRLPDQRPPAFLGVVERGAGSVHSVASRAELADTVGGPVAGGFLADAVTGFLANSAGPALVVGLDTADAAPDALTLLDRLGCATVCAPDAFTAADPDRVTAAVVEHCEAAGDRLALLDAPPDLTPAEVAAWRRAGGEHDSRFAVVYYPWLAVGTGSGTRFVPPCGHVAGVWDRCDRRRPVPASDSHELVRGAAGVSRAVSRAEQELLTELGVNSLRAFLGRGVRMWGARTLARDPVWRDASTRRLVSLVEAAVREGVGGLPAAAVAADPAGACTRIERAVRALLFDLWVAGALAGDSVAEAFSVRCVAAAPSGGSGEVSLSCAVGLALRRPGEFTVFRLARVGDEPLLVD